jgi:multidrug efflux pump subunit AcrA (membrane-fusion protein)
MRKSSIFILLGIFIVFVSIQGWVMSKKFLTPATFAASEATIMGQVIELRTPMQGTLTEVNVEEDQRVRIGDPLFTLVPAPLLVRIGVVADDEPIIITAPRSGIVNDVHVSEGGVIQADQLLAKIVDNSVDQVYIKAKIDVQPNEMFKIQPLLRAGVQASFLNNGETIPAVVSSVDPVYDAITHTVEVRLRFLEGVPEIADLGVGLPVTAWLRADSETTGSPVEKLLSFFLPTSEAEQ